MAHDRWVEEWRAASQEYASIVERGPITVDMWRPVNPETALNWSGPAVDAAVRLWDGQARLRAVLKRLTYLLRVRPQIDKHEAGRRAKNDIVDAIQDVLTHHSAWNNMQALGADRMLVSVQFLSGDGSPIGEIEVLELPDR